MHTKFLKTRMWAPLLAPDHQANLIWGRTSLFPRKDGANFGRHKASFLKLRCIKAISLELLSHFWQRISTNSDNTVKFAVLTFFCIKPYLTKCLWFRRFHIHIRTTSVLVTSNSFPGCMLQNQLTWYRYERHVSSSTHTCFLISVLPLNSSIIWTAKISL